MIFKKKITQISELATTPKSNRNKIVTLVMNEIFFLAIAPWLLLWPAQLLLAMIVPDCKATLPPFVTNFLSFLLILSGSGLSLWSVAVQWSQGQGTPSIKVPTRKLLTSGPYRWSRNPIQIGACLYIFGLGIWYDGLLTGGLAALTGLTIGILYITLIEEQELELRFGQSYIEYKLRTPFLIPGCRRGSERRP